MFLWLKCRCVQARISHHIEVYSSVSHYSTISNDHHLSTYQYKSVYPIVPSYSMISFTKKKKNIPRRPSPHHPTISQDPGHLQAPPSGIDWEAMSDQWMFIATEPVPMWPAFPPATVPWTAEGRGGLAPRSTESTGNPKTKIHVSFVLANPRLMVHCTEK